MGDSGLDCHRLFNTGGAAMLGQPLALAASDAAVY